MIEILKAHLDEIKENIDEIEKSILRQIVTQDNISFRRLDNNCMKLEHTLECLKELIHNIKSKNLREWTAKQQQ